ncbi:MAG: hypothetical protein QOF78_3391 [Phycisphaerales bacterium]|jgi:hypothetical protein|nr:hypothetical protein [Phycisphaerales bacterium]
MSVVILCAAILMSQETKGADAATTENAAATAGSDGAGGEVAPPAPATKPAADACSYWRVFWVMLLSGLIAGTRNILVAWEEEKKASATSSVPFDAAYRWRLVARHLIVAVAASFLIPLFLSMISSQLLQEARCYIDKLLILAGFCLVAGLSATRFIETVSDRVIKMAEDAKKQAANANAKADVAKEAAAGVQETLIEPPPPSPARDAVRAAARAAMPAVANDQKAVLRALAASPHALFTTESITAKLAKDVPSVEEALRALAAQNLVRVLPRINRPGEFVWGITEAGIEAAQ